MATQKRFLSKYGLDANSISIINVADPVANTDAVTKQFAANASNLTTGTLNVAQLPAFTGDATSSAGSSVLTLANSGVTAGTYTLVTVDAKGRVTSGVASGSLASRSIDNSFGYFTQSSFARQRIGVWNPAGNASVVPVVQGLLPPTTVGTLTARAVATTNIVTRSKRLGIVSTALGGNFAAAYNTALQYSVSTGTSLGGFFITIKFNISDAATVAGARMFVGMSNLTTAPTNVEPNTLTNCFGVAQLSTDATQLYFVYGGTVAQTAIPLGSTNFPINTANLYELALFSNSAVTNSVYWQITNLGNGTTQTSSLTSSFGVTTALPDNTTLLNFRAWRCNNATALAVGLDLGNIYVETDE